MTFGHHSDLRLECLKIAVREQRMHQGTSLEQRAEELQQYILRGLPASKSVAPVWNDKDKLP